MQISKISFKGYIEKGTKKVSLPVAKDEIEKARPYLKLIGNSLPDSKDLLLNVKNDGADDIFTLSVLDNRSGKILKINENTEHDFIGNGFWLVENTFKGLARHGRDMFSKTAAEFCLNFSKLERDMDPNYKDFMKGLAEVVTSPHDHCC